MNIGKSLTQDELIAVKTDNDADLPAELEQLFGDNPTTKVVMESATVRYFGLGHKNAKQQIKKAYSADSLVIDTQWGEYRS